MTIMLWVLTGAMLGVSVVFAKNVKRAAQRAASEWPTAAGRVVKQSIRGNGNGTFAPEISYVYEVDGRAYASDRLRPGGTPYFYSESKAAQVAAAYPVGKDIIVHYRQNKPASAAIDCQPMSHGLTVIRLMTAALLVALLVTFLP